jgi:hypothetical protein
MAAGHSHQKYRHAVCPECRGKRRRICYYGLGGIGNGWPSHDAFLEVNHD